MKVLVSGIAGLIGKSVCEELLANGHRVKGLDVRPISPDLREQGVEMAYVNVADSLAVLQTADGCDAIIHCAAYAQPFGRTAEEMIRTNVLGTQNMLDAAVAYGMKRVVVTSSVGALGFSFPKHTDPPVYLPVDFDHPRRPQDIYGLTKLMNEESAAAATRRDGIATVVIRPPLVVDLRKWVRSPWWPHRLADQSERFSDSLWAYVDVHDVAVAYRLAIEKDLTGHSRFYAMADDVMALYPAAELIRRYMPDLAHMAIKLTGDSLYDLTPAEEILGFKAKVTWRQIAEDEGVGLP